jgi:hypothetical protein
MDIIANLRRVLGFQQQREEQQQIDTNQRRFIVINPTGETLVAQRQLTQQETQMDDAMNFTLHDLYERRREIVENFDNTSEELIRLIDTHYQDPSHLGQTRWRSFRTQLGELVQETREELSDVDRQLDFLVSN